MKYEANFMVHKLTVSDVAIAYQIPRSTVVKHIRSGKIKVNHDNLIDYYQLIEFLGMPVRAQTPDRSVNLEEENRELKRKILMLESLIKSYSNS